MNALVVELRQELEVFEAVVELIVVAVMDIVAFWNRSVSL